MASFNLEILTPERKFFSGDVEMLVVQTPDGEIGVMKGHIPMVTTISIGPARILQNREWKEAVLNMGFMEISRHGAVVIVDTAEWPDEIDINRAEEAKIRAEERLHRKLSRMEYQRSKAALSRALARLKVFRHAHRK